MSGGESTVASPLGSPLGSPDVEEVDFEEFHFPDPLCTISLTAKVGRGYGVRGWALPLILNYFSGYRRHYICFTSLYLSVCLSFSLF